MFRTTFYYRGLVVAAYASNHISNGLVFLEIRLDLSPFEFPIYERDVVWLRKSDLLTN